MENHKLFQSNPKWRLYLTLGLALLFLVALLCGLQGVPMIQADPGTLHVDSAQGQDTPTCGTAIAPCQTILYALDNRASGGDTIRVAQGVYTEKLIVDRRVTLEGGYEPVGWTRSITQYETIIDGRGSVVSQSVIIFRTGSDGAALDGFTLRNGEARFGGGARIDDATVTISDTIFLSNTAEYGGGLVIAGRAMATIVGCQFISNTVSQNAGGLRVSGEVTIEDSVFQGNTAQGNGGAIQGQNLVVRKSRILDNHACNGGGIDVFGPARLENVELTGNAATNEGGGFRVGDGEMTVVISNTRILTNTASNGGGIHLYDGSISLYNTLVRGNTATLGTGGGIRASYFELRYSPELTLVNTLVVLNSAALPAGGIRLDRWPATLINTTVAHNNGGVLASPFPTQTVAFTNTILWDNGADDLQCSSGCTVAYSNLGEGVWPGTGNISTDPRFIDAANGDYHLYAASPCIDAGTLVGAPALDMEGTPRDAAPDMGAYEWTGSRIFLPLIIGGSSAPSLFSVEVVGYGEHGAMIELFYDGQWSDLEGVTIRMHISQDGRTKETQDVKVLGGRHLAEMTDAMYQFGEIDVELVLQEESSSARKIRMRAEFDQWYPFIHPVYAASDFTDPPLDIIETHGWEEGPEHEWYAKDFCVGPCVGDEQAPGEGTPVYMPFSFQIGSVREANNDLDAYPNSYNIWVFHPYTGFIFLLCHQVPGPVIIDFLGNQGSDLPTLENPYDDPYPYDTDIVPYDPNAIMSFWAPSDHPGGPPHLHLEGQISYPLLGLEHSDLNLPTGYIDGDPDSNWGNPRYNNCAAFGLENYGPCFTSDGQVAVANISMERFLLNDWVDPSR